VYVPECVCVCVSVSVCTCMCVRTRMCVKYTTLCSLPGTASALGVQANGRRGCGRGSCSIGGADSEDGIGSGRAGVRRPSPGACACVCVCGVCTYACTCACVLGASAAAANADTRGRWGACCSLGRAKVSRMVLGEVV